MDHPNRRLLLLSNSRNPGGEYLAHATTAIAELLGPEPRRLAFVPYAAVTLSFEDYASLVARVFTTLGHTIVSAHAGDPLAVLAGADGVVVGGGNTFRLLERICATGLFAAIGARVAAGMPYIGWSAGANLAGPTIRTTNDMPIIQPPSFTALGFVPFQLNPHYTDQTIPNHGGESRDERIAEFLALNPGEIVVGLREGSWLRVEGERVALGGPHPMRLFRAGQAVEEVPPGEFMPRRIAAG
jgi:dipeptidase E